MCPSTARPLPGSRYAVSMRGGTPQDDPQTERGPEPDASVQMLRTSHSLIYYTPVGLDLAAVDLMHEIDRMFATLYSIFQRKSGLENNLAMGQFACMRPH